MNLHAIVSDLETAKAAVEGGATVVQLRLKDAPTDQVVAVGAAFRDLSATFGVNDDGRAGRVGVDALRHLGSERRGGEGG